nr:hypothetical protein Itr_chr13CG04640 [Ipomoea trifida]
MSIMITHKGLMQRENGYKYGALTRGGSALTLSFCFRWEGDASIINLILILIAREIMAQTSKY